MSVIDAVDRFWAKVDKSGDCWLWTGASSGRTEESKYGIFWFEGRLWKAHRFSYFIANGELPDLQIDHRPKCSKRCVRPDHLRLATNKQNNENLAGAQVNSKSGVRGVVWTKRLARPWRAQAMHNRRLHSGGQYATIEEAEVAAIALRNRLFTHNDQDRVS
jgi:hypothetical protein